MYQHHGYPNDEISKIKEPMDTIFVKSVKDGSSAQHSGLKKGKLTNASFLSYILLISKVKIEKYI